MNSGRAQAQREVAVQASDVTKRYSGLVALDGVSLRVDRGEIVGLVGKNGAGKSTLIKVLAGTVVPDAGSIAVRGKAVKYSTPIEAQRLGLSFVHQDLIDVPGLTVAENVFLGKGYPKRMFQVEKRSLVAKARPALERVGLDVDPAVRQDTLGISQRRLVTIARALTWESTLLVLDEPTAALTRPEIEILHRVVRTLREQGLGVVYVSHLLGEILDLCDRTVVMRDGHVVAGRPRSDMTHESLVADITGSSDLVSSPVHRPPEAVARDGSQETPLLSTQDLAGRPAGEGVDLSVPVGTIVGIAGLIGSGRTHLLQMLFGIVRPARGSIRWQGEPVEISSSRRALDLGFGYLPENRAVDGIVPLLSVRENITIASLGRFRRIGWLPFIRRTAESNAARHIIDRLAIMPKLPERRIRLLSGGNQQKAVLGRSLLRGPKLYLLDEPTQGVDVEAKAEIFRIVRELADQGCGVILVSSDFAELELVCDEVLVMVKGKITRRLTGPDVTEAAMVKACYDLSKG